MTGGELAPGDAIVLYTDGLIETRHDHQLFGPDRLEHALGQANGRPAEVLADDLLAASRRFAPGEPVDDTALLVFRAA